MIINLKQSEIEVALKNYIVNQGINLDGKSVEINFTAGRKESGISAELDIEQSDGTAIPSGPINRTNFAADYLAVVPPVVEEEPEEVIEPSAKEVELKSGTSLFS